MMKTTRRFSVHLAIHEVKNIRSVAVLEDTYIEAEVECMLAGAIIPITANAWFIGTGEDNNMVADYNGNKLFEVIDGAALPEPPGCELPVRDGIEVDSSLLTRRNLGRQMADAVRAEYQRNAVLDEGKGKPERADAYEINLFGDV